MKKIFIPDYNDYATIIPNCNSIPKLMYEFTDLFKHEDTYLYFSIYSDYNNNLYAVID